MTALEMTLLLILSVVTLAVAVNSGLYAAEEEKKEDSTWYNLAILKSVRGLSAAFWMASLLPLANNI